MLPSLRNKVWEEVFTHIPGWILALDDPSDAWLNSSFDREDVIEIITISVVTNRYCWGQFKLRDDRFVEIEWYFHPEGDDHGHIHTSAHRPLPRTHFYRSCGHQ